MVISIGIDDGAEQDFRVLELLQKYKLEHLSTFYIAPYNWQRPVMSLTDIKRLSEFVEIGGHTETHALLSKLDRDECLKEVINGKMTLEHAIGKKITKFAYPKGHFNEEVKVVVKLCGFTQARTMKLSRTSLEGYDQYEIPISFHVYPRQEYKEKGILESFREVLKKSKEGGYLGVVLHSWELDEYNLWEDFEKILYEITLSGN